MARLHTNIPAPKAKKEPVTIEQLGFSRTDNYAWLKDKHWQRVMANPSELRADIKDHLKAENAYMAKVMAPTKKLQDALLDEFKGRIKDDDSSVPAPDGPFAYAHKFRPGDEHGLYIRTPRHTPQKDETILLDADALAQTYKQDGFAFFDIGAIAHSDDHKFLAYALDLQGSEQYQIFIKDIERARLIGPQIQASAGDLVWAADNQTLFWVERDENNRPCKVYRQNILSEGSAELVYDEDDPGFFVSIGRSDTGNWIEILCNDHTTSETWLIPAKSPKTAPKCARTRQRNIEYSLHDHGEDFYILTNKDNAIDFKIMKCTQTEVQNDTWETLVPHSPGTLILDVETYQGYLVRLERKNALPRIVIHNLETGEEHSIDFNEEAYALGLEGGY
ncbi:MAG TPA: S9 family peptidase, partial [Hellea balneolensis]|nr:S9 family peptidase [Hellea balneolensis]